MHSPATANDLTIRAYEVAAREYAAKTSSGVGPELASFLERFVSRLVAGAGVLEIGAGTGRDAAALELLGVQVRRTDAAESFVSMLRAAGHDADVLNVLGDDLGGPYDGVYANAVFLHFSPAELEVVLGRTYAATRAGGVLAFTVKVGEGERWTSAKIGEPRHYVYWDAESLREVIAGSPWDLIDLIQTDEVPDGWLWVLCRRS